MALIDVSQVILNPMLADTFGVTRRIQTVNNYGYTSTASTLMGQQAGVVWPSQPSERKALADLTVTDKTITILTTFRLYGESDVAGTEYQPDVVTWHGDSYLVRNVEDWSAIGSGFVQAICSSIDLVDAPPTTE